jgi:hypothetical protein
MEGRMRWLVLLTLLAGITGPLAAQRDRVVIVVPGKITRVVTDTTGVPIEYDVRPGLVFDAVRKVYAELKIPLTLEDSTTGEVGNLKFYRTGSLGGSQLSSYVSCGSGVTGPYADQYRVYIALRSIVAPAAQGGARLRTVLFAAAMDVSQGARQAMPCESNGRLEILIGKMVQRRLDAPF